MALNHSFSVSPRIFFRDLARFTVCRALQNEIISKIRTSGSVLDIGGGERSSYLALIDSSSYVSINIDPSMDPTFTIDPTDTKYPLRSHTFDHCLLFNVLEHVYDWSVILAESRRLLRPGGTLHILVPFLYPVHPTPSDYIRATDEYLKKALSQYDFVDIDIRPFNQGPFSFAAFIIPFPKALGVVLRYIGSSIDYMVSLIFPAKLDKYSAKFPLFYYARASLSVDAV